MTSEVLLFTAISIATVTAASAVLFRGLVINKERKKIFSFLHSEKNNFDGDFTIISILYITSTVSLLGISLIIFLTISR